ncbi:MAG TPA: hypothetical protein V6D20_21390 [Candidatus Obscuribacterales bacterium]
MPAQSGTKGGNALSLTGDIIQALGFISAGRESDEISERNALQLNASAERVMQNAAAQSSAIQRQGQRMVGAQRASTAARGIVVDRGSALDIITETLISTNLQAADINRNAQIQRSTLKMQANEQIRAGNVASKAGLIKGAGTILSGALNRRSNAQNA